MPTNKLKKDHIVVKQNALNEMRIKEMSLQELRLFSVYLSKINPTDTTTRVVQFSLEDFQAIMELRKLNVQYFQKVAYNLVRKTIGVPTERGGMSVFNIFRECTIELDNNGKWNIEIDADDRALPMLFDFQSHFFKYELWNALRLKGKNQLRMYEILKQNEKIGYRIVSISALKSMLGINENEYSQYKEFKRCVLEVCKKALSELTDISFTYATHSKEGRKINELRFAIKKNEEYVSPLHLDKFIDMRKKAPPNNKSLKKVKDIDLSDIDENGIVRSTGKSRIYEERIIFLMDACDNEFSREQIILLYDIMTTDAPDHIYISETKSHSYLQRKYREMNMRDPKQSRFGYLKTLISSGDK